MARRSSRRKPNRNQQLAGEDLLLHLRFSSGDLLRDSSIHPKTVLNPQDATSPQQAFKIVAHNTGDGKKYFINKLESTLVNETGEATPQVTLYEGITYEFDVSDEANYGHRFRLSTDYDGVHEGGDQFTANWEEVGVHGTEGGAVHFKPINSTPNTLYYYDNNQSQMGNTGTFAHKELKNIEVVNVSGYYESATGAADFNSSGCLFVSGSGENFSNDLALKKDFTIQFWAKQKETGQAGKQCLFDFGTVTGSIESGLFSDVTYRESGRSNDYRILSKSGYNLSGWNHYCLMRYSGILNYYVNGEPQGRKNYEDIVDFRKASSSGYYHSIGGTRTLANFFSGYIDDFMVHKLAIYGLNGFRPIREISSGKFPPEKKNGLTSELNLYNKSYSTGVLALGSDAPSGQFIIESGDYSHKLQYIFPREHNNIVLSYYHEPDLLNPSNHVVKFYRDTGNGEEVIATSDDTSNYLDFNPLFSPEHWKNVSEKVQITTDLNNRSFSNTISGDTNRNGYHLIINNISLLDTGTYSVKDWTSDRVWSSPRKVVINKVKKLRWEMDCMPIFFEKYDITDALRSGFRPSITGQGGFPLKRTLLISGDSNEGAVNLLAIQNFLEERPENPFHISQEQRVNVSPISYWPFDSALLGHHLSGLPECNIQKRYYRNKYGDLNYHSTSGCSSNMRKDCDPFTSRWHYTTVWTPLPRFHVQKYFHGPHLVLNSEIEDQGLLWNMPYDQFTGNRVLTKTGSFNIHTGVAGQEWTRSVVGHFSGTDCWLSVPRSFKYEEDFQYISWGPEQTSKHVSDYLRPGLWYLGVSGGGFERHGIEYPRIWTGEVETSNWMGNYKDRFVPAGRDKFNNYLVNSSDDFDIRYENFTVDLSINTDPSKLSSSGILFSYGNQDSGFYSVSLTSDGSLGFHFNNPTGNSIHVPDSNSKSILEIEKDKWYTISIQRTGMVTGNIATGDGTINAYILEESGTTSLPVWSGKHNGMLGYSGDRTFIQRPLAGLGFSFNRDSRFTIGRKEYSGDNGSHNYYSGYMCEFRMFHSGLPMLLTHDLEEDSSTSHFLSETGKYLKLLLPMNGLEESNSLYKHPKVHYSSSGNKRAFTQSEILTASNQVGFFSDTSNWTLGEIPYSGTANCSDLELWIRVKGAGSTFRDKFIDARLGGRSLYRIPYTSDCLPDAESYVGPDINNDNFYVLFHQQRQMHHEDWQNLSWRTGVYSGFCPDNSKDNIMHTDGGRHGGLGISTEHPINSTSKIGSRSTRYNRYEWTILPNTEMTGVTFFYTDAAAEEEIKVCVVDKVALNAGIDNSICTDLTRDGFTVCPDYWCQGDINPGDNRALMDTGCGPEPKGPPTGGFPGGGPVQPPTGGVPSGFADPCSGIPWPEIISYSPMASNVNIEQGQSLYFTTYYRNGVGGWVNSDGSEVKNEKGKTVRNNFHKLFDQTGKFCFKVMAFNSCGFYTETSGVCVRVNPTDGVKIIKPEK